MPDKKIANPLLDSAVLQCDIYLAGNFDQALTMAMNLNLSLVKLHSDFLLGFGMVLNGSD